MPPLIGQLLKNVIQQDDRYHIPRPLIEHHGGHHRCIMTINAIRAKICIKK